MLVALFCFVAGATLACGAVTIENKEVRLILSEDGHVQSLVYKPTGEECLPPGADVPAFQAVRYRGYTPPQVFPARQIRREGDRLIVSLAPLAVTAIVRLQISDSYLGFVLEKVESNAAYFGGKARQSEFNEDTQPFDELLFMQLPVKEREKFGGWLNVSWDHELAVALLGTDPYARIDSVMDPRGRVLRAAALPEVRLESVGAAIVVGKPEQLLERIAHFEDDFHLPHGARSRMSPELQHSYWEISEPITLANVDQAIAYARQAGLRAVQFYRRSFLGSVGHFAWREEYPRGAKDLRPVVDRLAEAGITSGFHLHFNKAQITDPYVTPVPDPRLNFRCHFTLAAPVDAAAKEIEIEENPYNSTLDRGRRLLRFGNELIEYEDYTTEPPYRFRGCKRGALGTVAAAHESGLIGGLLDVDNWPVYIRFNQNTSIQDEVADRLAAIYRDVGFKFVYFDGSEDVHAPYWFTVGWAQWRVYRKLQPEPLFSEASHLSHFNWHIASRSTADDVVSAEALRKLIRDRRYPEIEQRQLNFTRNDFGWIRMFPPGEKTAGMQPDVIEYAASHAASWGCPISITGTMAEFAANPRTPDNFEVIRRWEEARTSGWLTPERERELRDLDREHTLLIDENGNFELVACRQIPVGDSSDRLRAYLFERGGKVWVTYWDLRGESRLVVPLRRAQVRLYRDLGKALPVETASGGVIVPASERRYLEITGRSPAKVEAAFKEAKLL